MFTFFAYHWCYLLSFLFFIVGLFWAIDILFGLTIICPVSVILFLFHCVTVLLLFLFFAEAGGGGGAGAGDQGGGVLSLPVCCAPLGFWLFTKCG